MGWKTIKGNRYYYRVRREGGRVVTEYYGKRRPAELLARLVDMDRAERVIQVARQAEKRDQDAEIDQALDDLVNEAKTQAKDLLITAGCYQHKRQWRRRRRSERLDASEAGKLSDGVPALHDSLEARVKADHESP